jgi:hypothetical protein
MKQADTFEHFETQQAADFFVNALEGNLGNSKI